MKNQVLIVKGPGSAGKSTTIKLAFDMFLQWVVQKKKRATVHYLYLTNREIAAVVEVGANRVGIATRGDTEGHVRSGLSFFSSHGCKVVVCATRSRGKPLKAARDFSSKRLGVIPTEWPKPKDKGTNAQQAANQKMAKQLVRWLKPASR